MSETICITPNECNDISHLFKQEQDHAFIFPNDESNPTLICHGSENGTIYYNGKDCKLSEIIEDVRTELKITSQYFYLDVACCYAANLVPILEKGCTIRPRYLNQQELICILSQNSVTFTYQ